MLTLLLGAAVGVYPRAFLVALLPCALLDRFLARWVRAPGGGDGTWATGLVLRSIAVLLVVLGAAYAHHFTALARGTPGGGRGTAIVP
jgi:hypothetical protein